ncbi:MAG: exodeoxyribonuclease VII large subunit [Bacteroidetes bacterium]|nr:MAG: exodeoxyribonuclease VII large subunit [Bacteroidota bacterium]
MDTFSLLELNAHIRQVVALNFEQLIWVSCEISQARQSRGHHYLELVEKAEHSDDIRAQSSAVIWARTFSRIRKKCGDLIDDILQDGVEVRVQVRVDFHERYGLKLVIEDIDPSFTMGNLETRRREILETLQKKGLVEKNGLLPLPVVPQRIAVLSSEHAAGYHDFMQHLRENPYEYHFDTHLFPVALQGSSVEKEVVTALQSVAKAAVHYDCVAIIRGGGSRLDLSGFDNLAIGEAIAHCPIPVFTGIGHEIDQSVADIVANYALKTPTAVADVIIEMTATFEGEIDALELHIKEIIDNIVVQAQSDLRNAQTLLTYLPAQRVTANHAFLEGLVPQFRRIASFKIKQYQQQLEHASIVMKAVEPRNVLARGFSITRKNGKIVSNSSALKSGDTLETEFQKGNIKSTID